MSDYIPAEIHIGGPIPRAALAGLVEAILEAGGSLVDYGGPDPSEGAISDALKEGAVLGLFDDQQRTVR